MAAVILSGSRKAIILFAVNLFGNTCNMQKFAVESKRYMQ